MEVDRKELPPQSRVLNKKSCVRRTEKGNKEDE